MSSELKDPEFHARLAELIGAEQPYGWAARVGISKGAFARIWNEGTVPGPDHLRRIREVTGASIDWLLTGEGPKRRQADQSAAEYSIADKEILAGDEYVYLPLFNVRAAAGGGALVDTEQVLDVLAFKATWIRAELRANPASLYLIYVEGESMEPTLRPGDLILVDRSAAIRDGIFVLRLDDGLLVKRLQRLPGNQVKVTSDNPAYEPFSIDLSKAPEGLSIIGRVVWSGRRM